MFTDGKSPLKSLGVWGGGTGIVIGLLQMVGYTVQPAEVNEASQLITGLITSGAGLVALVGRIRARQKINL